MILLLPLLLSFCIYILLESTNNNILYENLIVKYTTIIIILFNIFSISIGKNPLIIVIMIIICYWLLNEPNKNDLYTIFFIITSIFIFYANSLYGFFISIELISFIMITFINLYIQNKYPGILYYLFSGLFTALFIFSLGYLYLGYNIAYSLISLVFIWKLGLGPLHILMPNIYNELSPLNILFIDIICKYLLFYSFYRLLISISINLYFILIISIILGTLLSFNEYNLLNILVYSSITNYGLMFILINNLNLLFLYLIFYSFMVIIYLYLIIHFYIHYSINNSFYIFIWFLLIMNLIGIPPFNGFNIKLYLLIILITNNSYFFILCILSSIFILSCVYIRILLSFFMNDKVLYFKNKNFYNTHFITSLIILLSFPFTIIL